MSFNASLLYLDLSYNNIGIVGCQHLQTLLAKQWVKLEGLALESNHLTDEMIQHILIGVMANTTLKMLNFSNN
jgi:hypothetical protein